MTNVTKLGLALAGAGILAVGLVAGHYWGGVSGGEWVLLEEDEVTGSASAVTVSKTIRFPPGRYRLSVFVAQGSSHGVDVNPSDNLARRSISVGGSGHFEIDQHRYEGLIMIGPKGDYDTSNQENKIRYRYKLYRNERVGQEL